MPSARRPGGTSRGREDMEDNMNVTLANLGNQQGRRQGRHTPNVPNEKIALAPIPIPPPALVPASIWLMERQNHTGPRSHFERLKKSHMPTFDECSCSKKTEKWINEMGRNFEVLETTEDMKVTVAKPFLVWRAEKWWKVWCLHLQLMDGQFNALGEYVPMIIKDDYLKMLKFEEGLLLEIHRLLSVVENKNYYETFERSIPHQVRDGEECQKLKSKVTKDFKRHAFY
ncbi:hypothetical protein M9H77_07451 [Catharanthus roseus]|uniref:Uncharacterized protein n=1 Tax=Catharanthus roseus TaxID=4058 RepID=A0ACC0BV07_CATRO|nr:hypothetical protein M9H77_07451 [Catharanthus roseus]